MKAGRHICTVCNNIYEESSHSGTCGCATEFDELPENWKCPECGTDKDKYQPCSCISIGDNESNCEVHKNV